MATRRAALRLLLVLVALGVAGMHTLGHLGTGHGFGASHPMKHDAPSRAMLVGAPQTALVGPVMFAAIATEAPAGLDPLEVCLAILASAGLMALLGLLVLAWPGGCGLTPRLHGAFAIVGRGPPRTPHGLCLADLSVQRR